MSRFTESMSCPECGGYGVVPVAWDDHARNHSCYHCMETGLVAAYSVLPYSAPAWRLLLYADRTGCHYLFEANGELVDKDSYESLLARADALDLAMLSDSFRPMDDEVRTTMSPPDWDGYPSFGWGNDMDSIPF